VWGRDLPGPVPPRGPAGPRGLSVDVDEQEFTKRNVVERAFNKLGQWRGLTTRYDKHALTHRGGAVLASIVVWAQRMSSEACLGSLPPRGPRQVVSRPTD